MPHRPIVYWVSLALSASALGQPGLYYIPGTSDSNLDFLRISSDGTTVYGGQGGTWSWTPGEGRMEMPATVFTPKAVSDNGQIMAGDYWYDHVPGQDIVWPMVRTPDGQQNYLGPFVTLEQRVSIISAQGNVICGVTRQGSYHDRYYTWRWTADTGLINMDAFGLSIATDCSDDGSTIIGTSDIIVAAQVWRNGVTTFLPGLDPDNPNVASATACNSDGTLICGNAFLGPTHAPAAAIWENDVPRILPTPAGFRPYVRDISNDGSVAIGNLWSSQLQYDFVWTDELGALSALDYFAMFGIQLSSTERYTLEKVSEDGTVFAGTRTFPNGSNQNFVVITPAPAPLAILGALAAVSARPKRRGITAHSSTRC
ncbi:hypothetical protein PHYC_02525 [Phycisphaerales bacterium]|nr:hypothetical protein PHYC_02525 [Phycisphaerales bacterium]